MDEANSPPPLPDPLPGEAKPEAQAETQQANAPPAPLNGNGAPVDPQPEGEQVNMPMAVAMCRESVLSNLPGGFVLDVKKPLDQQVRFAYMVAGEALNLARRMSVNLELLAAEHVALANITQQMFELMFKDVPDGPNKPAWQQTYDVARIIEFMNTRERNRKAHEANRIIRPVGSA